MTELSLEFDRLCNELGLSVPDPNTVVHKTECLYSIDNEYSVNGIYVNLLTYQSFGKEMLKFDPIYPNCIYLNITKRLIPYKEEENEVNTNEESTHEEGVVFKEKKSYDESVEYKVYSPQLGSIALDQTFGQLLNICNSIIGHAGYEFKNNELSFSDILQVKDYTIESKHSKDLYQVENPKQINYENVKCEKCNSTTNLWLNLSDGYVGCGRKNYNSGGCQDGTEGAAILHYQETGSKYHLAVKIGTITPTSADVYSYSQDEDNLVIDPLLEKHLKHFGINMNDLKKTEKTLLQLEIEDNKNYNWLTDTDGSSLIHLEPRLIGILNLGNNCYLNSVLQLLNNVNEMNAFFINYYKVNFENRFENVNLFLLQYAKICTCINTTVFINKCNYILEHYKKLKLAESNNSSDEDVSDILTHNCFYINPNLFKYTLGMNSNVFNNNEQQDAEEFLSYFINYLFDNVKEVKSLFNIELKQIIICNELKLINVNKIQTHILPLELINVINTKHLSNPLSNVDTNEIEIDINECLSGWYNGAMVDYINNGKVHKANLYNNLTNSPTYLFVKLNRFYMDKNVPKKLLNKVSVTGEHLQLNLNNLNLKEFGDYKLSGSENNKGFYENLKLLGFYGNSVDKVVNYYENLNQSQEHDGDHERTTVSYNLIGFITHIGSNVNSGHYICHLKKDNEWYAFNDTRISKSTNPPIHNGYIYLFQKS
ncbi:ubiquitin carboxyl-terminal hydrolase (UBP14) [Theileria annulata]|uniref:Ubiquitin carboxyl-terminal hydrolase n=1 Tax=Theileria annulata TaxID=5874 RepID=Q4UGQ2_THEAN|nr:ubiquitin carboxyl-terminal hydrolase (UBP14) [Theileria annulata]CAI73737.1 ubiquitin carboxyl-terminal hydrolase (UBP14 homologue), putative [Theileria annulata]|eukprot:XP_954414.1 ubiquitin carboxyl-terminal hydrolase (UBP14 homologue), putative [Theileria annulata]